MIEPAEPRRLVPDQVRYLAFEGGGAKGVAFIGALAALDALGVRLQSGGHGRIRGLSGASAGSMTAFLFAMRFTPEQMIEIQMADRAFSRFFQAPEPNVVRAVTPNGYERLPMVRWVKVGARRRPAPVVDQAVRVRMQALAAFPFVSPGAPHRPDTEQLQFAHFGSQLLRDLGGVVQVAKWAIAPWLQGRVRLMLRKSVPVTSGLAPLVNRVTASDGVFFDYCYSLLFDLGLFSGIEVRTFLKEQLARFLSRTDGASSTMRGSELDRVSVAQFAGMTKTAVAFAGTNVSTGRSAYFRAAPESAGAQDTPDFPVLDAVAISAAYPLAFKPYVIFDRRGVENGYWLDGGIQNNLPLHAFDRSPVTALNPGMLGIRLEESTAPFPDFIESVAGYFDASVFGLFATFLGSLLNSAMYPSEGGQVRTPQEEAQTVSIKIPAEVLSTLAFEPPRKNASEAILIAFDAVADYFVPGFHADQPPASDASPEEIELHHARQRLLAILPMA